MEDVIDRTKLKIVIKIIMEKVCVGKNKKLYAHRTDCTQLFVSNSLLNVNGLLP